MTIPMLYNPYAAMPSLHFGWALLVGIMAFTFKPWIIKAIGLLYPFCMAIVIVTTGHHHVLDVLGGATLVGFAYGLVKALSRTRSWSLPIGVGIMLIHLFSGMNPRLLQPGGRYRGGLTMTSVEGLEAMQLR